MIINAVERLDVSTNWPPSHFHSVSKKKEKEEDKRKTIKTPWKLSIIFISAWWILPAECTRIRINARVPIFGMLDKYRAQRFNSTYTRNKLSKLHLILYVSISL